MFVRLALVAAGALAVGCGPQKIVRRAGAPDAVTTTTQAAVTVRQRDAPLPPPTLQPLEIRAALWEIRALQRRGEASRARREFAERAERAPTLENRFLAAMALPDDQEGWKALRALVEEQPKFYWARAGMVAIYIRWGVADQVEKDLAKAERLLPGEAFTHTLRGDFHRSRAAPEAAVAAYGNALQLAPWDVDARVGRALARRSLGEEGGLRADLERALQEVPTHFEAAEHLALHLDAAREPAALQAWSRVESLAPRHRGAKLALARLRGGSDAAGAITMLEQAAQLSALDRSEQAQLTQLYRQVGRTADEARALQGLARLDPKDPAPWRRLAQIHEADGDADAAEDAYRQLLALNEKDAAALLGTARIHERRARIREAIDGYRAAAQAGEPNGQREAKRLQDACHIPARPVQGKNLTELYRSISASLEGLYAKRLLEAPRLKGHLRASLEADAKGRVLEVRIAENTLNDPWIEAHLYFVLATASWTRAGSDPQRFSLTFDLPPVKQ